MKKITFKEIDSLSGIDLTTIAYSVALLIGVCCKVNLSITFCVASALCTYVSFKKSKISLTILNGVLSCYFLSEVWTLLIETITNWWDQIISNLWWI